MYKNFLLLTALFFITLSAWAQVVTTASAVSVCTGATTVDIPVKVSSFTAVGSISLKFSYINSEITSPSVVYIDGGLEAWDTFEANTGTAGTIIISAYDPDITPPIPGLTLANNTILFTLRFNIGTITNPAVLSFVENIYGNTCEYTGVGPNFTPFIDTPQSTYYINGSVTVVADPSWTAYTFPTTSLCNGGFVTFSAGINAGLGGTVSWIRSSTSGGSGTTVTSPDAPGIGTWYYRPHYAPIGLGCNLADGTETTVTVVADPSWTAYTFPVTSLCNGGSVTFSAGINAGIGGTVTWIRSTTSGGSGTTVTSPDVPGIGTWYYRPHYAPTGEGCNLSDGTETTVTVVADPSWTAYTFPVTSLCNGGSVTFSAGINAGLGGAVTWIRSTTSGGSGTTVTSPDVPGIGTWYYRPHYAPTGEGCNLADGTETIVTVVADPSWTAYNFPTTSLCNGGSVTFSAGINAGLGGTVTWIRSTTSGGSGTIVTSPDAPGIGTWYYRPHYAPTGEGCNLADGTETTVTVVADPLWTAYTFPTTSLCTGGSVTFSAGINAGLGGTITWIRSISAGGSGITVTSPDAPGVGTWYYRPQYAPNGVGCNLADGTETTVTVVADPVAPGLTKNPLGATVCAGQTLTVTTSAGNGGTGTIADEYRYSTNNGSNWSAWNASVPSFAAVAGTNKIQSRRTASGLDCNESSYIEVSWNVNAKQKISGNFYYYNSSGDILMTDGDITVKIYKSSDLTHSDLLGTVNTDDDGYYEFQPMCPSCEYDIVATSTHPTAGAINTTDAAKANFWGPNPTAIEKVKFHAGDVVGPNLFISGTDAGRIQQNFVLGSPFDGEPWTFWKAGFSILHNPLEAEPEYTEYYPKVNLSVGSDLDADMYGLVTGDFNLSFDPTLTKSASSTLDIIYSGNIQISNNQQFDLPVRIVNSASIGAVSLILNFPPELVEVQDVLMDGAGGRLDWAVKGNELRIGWNSPVALNLTDAADLVVLRLKTAAGFTIGNSIRINLASNPLNELADGMYDVIGNALISVDVVDAIAVGISEQAAAKEIAMNCYPNPFNDFTLITYNLPFEGKVSLDINNILGNKVTTLVSETQVIGMHKVKFDTYGLKSGIYTATLRLKSDKDEMIRTIKLINNK